MEFGRDDDQLILVSATAYSGFFAAAYDLKQPNPTPMNLEIPRSPVRWRNGFGQRGSLAVSPGRNYLAVGEGRWVDLIRLSDGKPAGRCDLPGDCVTVAFSADGTKLAVHSHIAPLRKRDPEATVNQWCTFSLADGKRLSLNEVTGGPDAGAILAAGPKPGLAVHADRSQVTVTDTRYAPRCSPSRFPLSGALMETDCWVTTPRPSALSSTASTQNGWPPVKTNLHGCSVPGQRSTPPIALAL